MLLKQRVIALLLLFLCSITYSFTNKKLKPKDYIERHYQIAIREMHRSGIPASITLAQGIHESAWGGGKLAINSNNHFGIKCKKTWSGPSYYIEDDDYDASGKLMQSCFRAYQSVEDSYIDHTNFLLSNTRYKRLFAHDQTDYKSWARGLKQCGYATDPNYAIKLIRTIEEYDLHQYDSIKPQTAESTPTNYAMELNFTSLIPTVETREESTPPEAVPIPDNYFATDDNGENAIIVLDPAEDYEEVIVFDGYDIKPEPTEATITETPTIAIAEEEEEEEDIFDLEEENTVSAVETPDFNIESFYQEVEAPLPIMTTKSPERMIQMVRKPRVNRSRRR